jgi:hypothetical protein
MRLTARAVRHAAVRRELGDELEWFFAYAEKALRCDRLSILPSAVAARTPQLQAKAKARQLAEIVDDCLGALSSRDSAVLRAVFTPRRWPRRVERAFKHLSPVAVRLFCRRNPWPLRFAHQGLEDAAAIELAQRLHRPAIARKLRVRANQLFRQAVVAYVKRRLLEAPLAAELSSP